MPFFLGRNRPAARLYKDKRCQLHSSPTAPLSTVCDRRHIPVAWLRVLILQAFLVHGAEMKEHKKTLINSRVPQYFSPTGQLPPLFFGRARRIPAPYNGGPGRRSLCSAPLLLVEAFFRATRTPAKETSRAGEGERIPEALGFLAVIQSLRLWGQSKGDGYSQLFA